MVKWYTLIIYTDHCNIFNNTGKRVKYITVVKNVRHLNIHNLTTFNNQPQGKKLSIAYNGDGFVKILSVQHYVKRKRFEIAFEHLGYGVSISKNKSFLFGK